MNITLFSGGGWSRGEQGVPMVIDYNFRQGHSQTEFCQRMTSAKVGSPEGNSSEVVLKI